MNKDIAIVNTDSIVQSLFKNNAGTRGLTSRHSTLARRWFPSKIDRIVDEAHVGQAAIIAEQMSQALEMKLKTDLDTFRESCNERLFKVRGDRRMQMTHYFSEVSRQLESELGQMTEAFMKEVEADYQRLDRITIPALKEREVQRIQKKMERWYDSADKNMAHFYSLLDQKIELAP